MRTHTEKEYLLKAVDAFKRRLIVISPEFKILAANLSDEEIQESSVIGKLCYEVFYERSTPCENCAAKEAIQTRRSVLRPKNQNKIDLGLMPCLYAYPIIIADHIDAIVSMDFDLTTERGLEEKLMRSNAFLHNLILSAVNGVIAADKSGKIIFFNDVASEIFGYSFEEALNYVNIRDIYPGNGAYDVMAKLRSEAHGGRGKLKFYQVDVLTKNGEKIPVSLNASIVYEGDKELASIGFFHDLREERKLKEDLEKTQLQLLQAEKMSSLGKLSAGVAHQLNNPLSGIILFTKLIMEEYQLEPGAREDLKRILKDAERCRDTVKELLEFSRQTRYLKQPHDINQAISRTLFLLENQALFHNIEIEKDLASSLPHIQADIQQLNHLFMNLILNAAQAMEGKGKLAVKTYSSLENDNIVIKISDTGPGIPKDVFQRIFDPFFTTKNEGEGTGLGLSLAFSIVEEHGGDIRVKNNPDAGATFTVELPINQSDNGENQSGK